MTEQTTGGSTASEVTFQGNVRLTRRTIPIDPTAPKEARTALADVLGTGMTGALLHAQLLVSELASHRVRLAPPGREGFLELVIALTPRCLQVQVSDDLRPPHREQADRGEPLIGWELQIVAELADRWGMRHDKRTTLWFELDL